MSAPELKVAAQCLVAKFLATVGELAGRDLMMNVSLEGHRATISAAAFANEPFIAGTFSKAVAVLIIGAVLGCALGLLVVWLIQRTMSSQGQDTLADRVIGLRDGALEFDLPIAQVDAERLQALQQQMGERLHPQVLDWLCCPSICGW